MAAAVKDIKNLIGISKFERKGSLNEAETKVGAKDIVKDNPIMRRVAMKFMTVADTTESEDEL
jgi:hypothetical protein